MARVRKLGRRTVERGGLLSDEPALRDIQLRFLGVISAIGLLFFFLAFRKLLYLFGTIPVAIGCVTLAGAGLGGVLKLRRTGPVEEPKDEELEVVDTELDEQLLRGAVQPMDLVFERGRWTTLHESVRFAESAEGPLQRQRRAKQLSTGVFVLLGLGLLAGLGVLMLNFGRFMSWLADVG